MQNIERLATDLKSIFKKYVWRIEIAGSIRRKKPNPRDIDLLVIPKKKNTYYKLGEILITMGAVKISLGPKKTTALFRKEQELQVDIIFTNAKSWGAALMYLTGPAGANIWNRKLAMRKGMILNQYGLFNRKTGKRIPAYTERSIYKKLGKSYREPWERGKKR